MVRRSAGRAHQAPGHPGDEDLLGHVDEDRPGDGQLPLGEEAVEGFRLGEGPRKAVEHHAWRGGRRGERLADHRDRDLVGDQLAPAHVALGNLAERGAVAHRSPEQVAGRQVEEAMLLGGPGRLGPLAGRDRAEQDEHHRMKPS